ncbi:putative protein kinase RLK-Pelle-LRR-I-1 family [Helianthus debilis subsp. tardiflorus]
MELDNHHHLAKRCVPHTHPFGSTSRKEEGDTTVRMDGWKSTCLFMINHSHTIQETHPFTKSHIKIQVGPTAIGLDFLHGGDSPVIHRGIKSYSILLNGDWKAKITDFGFSLITSINDEIDFVVANSCGTRGYIDPKYRNDGFLTRESDIYSLGVVLCEMMCGRTAYSRINKDDLADLVKRHCEEGKADELVFKGIKDQIVPKSMVAFLKIAYECLYDEREKRPKASEVVLQLKKALEFQEDIEIWEAKLPKDYKEIIHMSKNPKIYSNLSNKDLCEKFSNGILLQNGKTCLSVKVNGNGERSETVSATLFSYENNKLHNKRISISNSRYAYLSLY